MEIVDIPNQRRQIYFWENEYQGYRTRNKKYIPKYLNGKHILENNDIIRTI